MRKVASRTAEQRHDRLASSAASGPGHPLRRHPTHDPVFTGLQDRAGQTPTNGWKPLACVVMILKEDGESIPPRNKEQEQPKAPTARFVERHPLPRAAGDTSVSWNPIQTFRVYGVQ